MIYICVHIPYKEQSKTVLLSSVLWAGMAERKNKRLGFIAPEKSGWANFAPEK